MHSVKQCNVKFAHSVYEEMDEHRSPFSFSSQAFSFPAQTGIVKRLDKKRQITKRMLKLYLMNVFQITRERLQGAKTN